jgi:hypothetical protein
MEPHTESFFAVQLRRHETPHQLAAEVLRTASEARVLFRRLDTLDIIDVGGRDYVRFRADLINPFPILNRLLRAGRRVVGPGLGSYLLWQPSINRGGRVPGTPMHLTPIPGHFREYRGTRTESWAAQFEAA